MRTTITLEKDVADRLKRLRKTRPFKELVNDVLRAGLDEIEKSTLRAGRRYSLMPVQGYPRRTNLDNVAEIIDEVEGNGFGGAGQSKLPK